MQRNNVHILRSDPATALPTRRAVLLFARSPQSEAQAKPIHGLDAAARLKLFTALTRRAVQTATASGYDLIVATDAAVPVYRNHAVALLRQRGNDFSERLLNALRETFALGYDEVAVIGNDSPELSGDAIDAVMKGRPAGALSLCRADDGGVTMLAAGRELADSLPLLFAQSRWETAFLFDDLANAATSENIPVDEHDGGSDVDTVADLIRCIRSLLIPRELRELIALLWPITPSAFSVFPYIRPLHRTLRACRQKAPPFPFRINAA